jgi:acyl carrier protein
MTVKAFSAGFLSAVVLCAVVYFGHDDSTRAYVPMAPKFAPQQAFMPANAPQVGAYAPAPHAQFPMYTPRAGAVVMGVEEDLRDLVVENLAVDAGKVTSAASFTDDLEADSLDVVELVMAIEEKWDIEIPEEQAASVSTFGELVKEVEKLTK